MFSELLKKLRAQKNVTQSQLAKEIGVSTGNVGDWETGKSKPGYIALANLARFFGVSADYLLGLSPENAIKSNSTLKCDGIPLNETEMDMISMYRYLDGRDRGDVFDYLHLKYDKATGEKASIYSTYTDTHEPQDGGPQNMSKTGSGIA